MPTATICANIGIEPVQSDPLLVCVLVYGGCFDLQKRAKSALALSVRFRLGHHSSFLCYFNVLEAHFDSTLGIEMPFWPVTTQSSKNFQRFC